MNSYMLRSTSLSLPFVSYSLLPSFTCKQLYATLFLFPSIFPSSLLQARPLPFSAYQRPLSGLPLTSPLTPLRFLQFRYLALPFLPQRHSAFCQPSLLQERNKTPIKAEQNRGLSRIMKKRGDGGVAPTSSIMPATLGKARVILSCIKRSKHLSLSSKASQEVYTPQVERMGGRRRKQEVSRCCL